MPSTPMLSRSALRQILRTVLPATLEFDAFCVDPFADVTERFSRGLTRTALITLLGQLEDRSVILAKLQAYGPGRQKLASSKVCP